MHLTVCPGCYASCDVMTTPIPYCWGKCTAIMPRDHMATPLSLVEGGKIERGRGDPWRVGSGGPETTEGKGGKIGRGRRVG